MKVVELLCQCPKCHRRGWQTSETCPSCGTVCRVVTSKKGKTITHVVKPPKPPKRKKLSRLQRIKADHMYGQRMPYKQYLRSSWWKWRRLTKIKSVGGRCAKCPNRRYLQVHHLNYLRLWDEQDADLQVLCSACHEHEHRAIIEMNQHFAAI